VRGGQFGGWGDVEGGISAVGEFYFGKDGD